MNKKALGTALLAGLVLGMGSTVYAEEADVKYEKDSTYKLTIPTEPTVLTSAGATTEVKLTDWNIAPTKELRVTLGETNPSGSLTDLGVLTLKRDNATSITTNVTIENQDALAPNNIAKVGSVLFRQGEGQKGVTPDKVNKLNMSSFNDDNAAAGIYTVQLTFVGQVQ